MKTLQVSMVNRRGQTLRGIVTLPDTEEQVPCVLFLHGFMSNIAGYKGLNIRIARALADAGIGCARFDFYGNGESDGEFQDSTFTGVCEDALDLFGWLVSQPFADPSRCYLSGQSMGGYVAASCAPKLKPRGLLLLCPGSGMWFGCAQRADAVLKSGQSWFDMEGICFDMAFNYDMAKHPSPYVEAQGYDGPVLLIRAQDDKVADESSFLEYIKCYRDPEVMTTETGGHNFTSIPVRKAVTDTMTAFIQKHT